MAMACRHIPCIPTATNVAQKKRWPLSPWTDLRQVCGFRNLAKIRDRHELRFFMCFPSALFVRSGTAFAYRTGVSSCDVRRIGSTLKIGRDGCGLGCNACRHGRKHTLSVVLLNPRFPPDLGSPFLYACRVVFRQHAAGPLISPSGRMDMRKITHKVQWFLDLATRHPM